MTLKYVTEVKIFINVFILCEGLERLRPVYAPKDFLEVLFSLHNSNYRMLS